MELSTRYSPAAIEDKWYQHWMERNYFRSTPDEREPYTIVIAPPNVTGVLHMGHILNNTINDLLIRKARMQGKNACWVPGTDHASIATEAKVVRWLKEEKGITKGDITREQFIEYAWEWTHKYGGIILKQLQRLGASCDWDRTAFTMDEIRSKAVFDTFIDLYHKGKLYRKQRMVNWDPVAKTVLSNEEVIYHNEQTRLHYVNYPLADDPSRTITIATTRPETILGDTAIAVHPEDNRYLSLVGKQVRVPLTDRTIPIIADEYVDREFGTGALKITPAHDPNDYEIGLRHDLPIIDVLNEDGTLSEAAGLFIGEDRDIARKKISKQLEAEGFIEKIENYMHNVGRSERTNSVIEPRLSLQWYVDMKSLAEPALNAVENDDVVFIPENMKNTYRHWMENIRDWCISRQLWWGHRIPAYYLANPQEGEHEWVFVAVSPEEALAQANAKVSNRELTPDDLIQDEDVLDTWFSSWLWPITVFNGFESEEELNYYYPTQIVVTGWDIIFLWIARMIMAGLEFKNLKPYDQVYFTGMVRDMQRRKMSKSLGNSPDALKLIDDFGADGVRFGILSSSPAGGDLLFEEKLCEQGRNFSNKMWNACRLVRGWEINDEASHPYEELAVHWFQNKLLKQIGELVVQLDTFKLSEGLIGLYSFIWTDFCSWYLEMVKPPKDQPLARSTYEQTIEFFETLMKLLHPYMPFITEEIWHQLRQREEGDDLLVQSFPGTQHFNDEWITQVEYIKELVGKVRDERHKLGIKMMEPLTLFAQKSAKANRLVEDRPSQELLLKMANLDGIQLVDESPKGGISFIAGAEKYFIVPNVQIDIDEQRETIQKDLDYAKGFVASIEKKLGNERFVQNAPPEVVERERKKLSDGLARVKGLEEALAELG